MNRSIWHRLVPAGFAVVVLGVVVPGLVAWFRTPRDGHPLPLAPVATAPVTLPPGSYPTSPLTVGALSPAFEAAGWVNSAPPPPGGGGPRLIVLDIWAHW